ncbi:MAG: insulinase family protein [Culturomica sp.]|jgi:predicted Zn-dependent peptidase|nr:insulinase family protein [Culturomica sp.]
MIVFSKHTLDNGLTLLCNTDTGTPFVTVNTLYKVGSRDEDPEKTGFAHLFEHLMFGGSENAPDFDREVQAAGGENNAYTTNDYTNYYITVPAGNIETALWLEADRMAALTLSRKSLDIQKNVVMEEYKQRYLNAPYGDVWLALRPLAYRVHPYRWPTIGISLEHIEKATPEDVRSFFHRFYRPDNAVISISGNIGEKEALEKVKKWFGEIPPGGYRKAPLPVEPEQRDPRRLVLEEKPVPADMLFKTYHMGSRLSDRFYCCDVISDLLSNGQSSRLYLRLVKEKGIFSELNAYVTGDSDPGLFVCSGALSEGVGMETAEKALLEELDRFASEPVGERELRKVVNKINARLKYSEINYQNKANTMALFEFLGASELINGEGEKYGEITAGQLQTAARELFRPENSSTLLYLKK